MLKKYAQTLEIDYIAAIEAKPLQTAATRFYNWLKAGRNAQMSWLEKNKEKRTDPRTRIPEAKTVVVALQSYHNGELWKRIDKCDARLALYAHYLDYHNFLGEKMKKLAAAIRADFPNAKTYTSVDTGAVLERAFAVETGLGFQGKNTSFIHPEAGANCFIGVLITDAELPKTGYKYEGRGCEGCDACLKACPTGALVSPYLLDARKCLSYHTIENRGSLPDEIKLKTQNRVFGCDECYKACPYNIKAKEGERLPTLILKPEKITLEYLLELDEKEFKKKFAQTPVSRAKLEGLLRNALVCAGNAANPALAPLVMPHLASEAPTVAEAAQWPLKRIGI